MNKAHESDHRVGRTLNKTRVTLHVGDFVSRAQGALKEARRYARERPGVALAIAFGAGALFGGSIANRLVRLAVYSAIGAGIQALLRAAPGYWSEAMRETRA